MKIVSIIKKFNKKMKGIKQNHLNDKLPPLFDARKGNRDDTMIFTVPDLFR
jgi:hypothetical protein